ncbi:MAG: class I SAM-dependent methyltransferase [Polyangiaceae bacterium]
MKELEAAETFDSRCGTDTGAEKPRDTGWYLPLPSAAFAAAMSTIEVPYEDYTFIDIGSGKARVVMMASEYPFKRCLGVERDPDWHAIAKRNFSLWSSPKQRCRDLDVVCEDVMTWEYPHDNLFIVYHNALFEPDLLRFLDALKRSVEAHPRRIVFDYHVPRYTDAVLKHGLFHLWGPQGDELHFGRGVFDPIAPLPVHDGKFPFAVFSNF